MALGSARDPRYDVVFRESYLSDPATGYQVNAANGDLPLMLTEQGSLGYTVGLTSPYGGRLSQGDLQNADLSQYTARTQRDWSGGRGELESYGTTTRYNDATADTRFSGRIMPGPQVIAANWQTGGGSSSTASTPATVRAKRFRTNTLFPRWTARGRDLMGASDGQGIFGDGALTARANTITDIEVFGSLLYLAYGDSVAMETFDTAGTFAAVAGREATYLLTYNGYLYTLTTTGVLEYFNGTAWSSSIQIGRSADEYFTGITGYKNQVIIASDRALYSISADIPYTAYPYDDMRSSLNGYRMAAWIGDGRLYVPIQNSLWAWDGTTMEPAWMDTEEDVPAINRGTISFILPTTQHLFVAVDAGASGRSAIYARTRAGTWHTIHRSSTTGRRIQALYYHVNPSTFQHMLNWHETGGDGYYMNITDSRNDENNSDLRFIPSSTLDSSWIGSELRLIDKEINSVLVGWEPYGTAESSANLQVHLECDRTGIWSQVGSTLVHNTVQAVFQISEFATTAPSYATTVLEHLVAFPYIAPVSTSGIVAGQFIRIGREVRQVVSVGGGYLQLQRPFDTQYAVGTPIVGSVPVAREFRYRITLTAGPGGGLYYSAPIVHSVSLKYQDQLVDKYRFTLQVRVEDEMSDRAGGSYPYTAAQLRTLLYSYLRRATPFRVIMPTGELFTCKVANMNEAQFMPQTNAGRADVVNSMMIVSLIEV